MKSELNNCHRGVDDHTATCAAPESLQFIPTRLIDVRNTDLRLVGKAELVQQGQPKYAALSYCWGTKSELCCDYSTTAKNEQLRKSGLGLNPLPPVLQDAVMMARALSLPYLWVDAICILQDQADDWQRESAELDRIYGSAFVTIASLTSSWT